MPLSRPSFFPSPSIPTPHCTPGYFFPWSRPHRSPHVRLCTGWRGGSWLEIRLPNAPSQEDAQGCSMVYGRKTKKGRQGEGRKSTPPRVGGKGCQERGFRRLRELDPRGQEGLEGSRKGQTVEPCWFQCVQGRCYTSRWKTGGRLMIRTQKQTGKGEKDTIANSGKHKNCPRQEINAYHSQASLRKQLFIYERIY